MALLPAIPSWAHALEWTRPVTVSIGGEVRRDFEEGGPLARNHWDAFLRRFDPDVLVMRREEGNWKAGLVETFWTR